MTNIVILKVQLRLFYNSVVKFYFSTNLLLEHLILFYERITQYLGISTLTKGKITISSHSDNSSAIGATKVHGQAESPYMLVVSVVLQDTLVKHHLQMEFNICGVHVDLYVTLL